MNSETAPPRMRSIMSASQPLAAGEIDERDEEEAASHEDHG
jgi:hypothetical protein